MDELNTENNSCSIPSITIKFRYALKYDSFGASFYDNNLQQDMTFQEVLELLNGEI